MLREHKLLAWILIGVLGFYLFEGLTSTRIGGTCTICGETWSEETGWNCSCTR